MRRRARALVLASLAATAGLACEDSTTVDLLEIEAAGAILGTAYLDVNGNDSRDVGDTPLRGLSVVLTVAGGGRVVEQVVTDTAGFFMLLDVPVGTYRVDIAPGALGDSLEAAGGGTEVKLARGDTTRVDFGASYPTLSLSEVRDAQAGRKVFTSGIALNPRLNFGDGLVHLQADSAYLRAINVARADLSAGDSVRFLGRIRVDQGQRVLDDVTPFVLIRAATIPQPREVTTAEAVTARGGSMDAALVRIRNAAISDTATVDGNFRFRADDGSGKVDVVVRSFLQLNTAAIRPDTVLRMSQLTGLLVPALLESGESRWRILPRGGTDILIEFKQADLSVTVTADKSAVVKHDTITFTVAVRNAGPLGASGVQVTDSLPTVLGFVDATATRGTYNATSGIWDLDSLAVGGADTLRLRGRVTTDLVGQAFNQARVSRLLFEVDPNPSNDGAQVPFTVSQKLSDLGLRMLVNKTSAFKRDTLTYTVILTNEGPREATGVQVSDTIPFGLTFLSSEATRGSYDLETGVWNVGNVAVGAADTLTLHAEITTDLTGTVTNRARVSRIVDGGDPNSANNTAQLSTTVATRLADLALGMAVDKTSPFRGDTLTFTIALNNSGPQEARSVQVADTLSAGLTFLDATATRGSYDPGTGIWSVGDAAVGSADTLRIRAELTVNLSSTVLVANRARVSRIVDGGDPNPANNVAQVTLGGPAAPVSRQDGGRD